MANVALTGSLTADQTTQVTDLLTSGVSAIVSLFYTIVTTITNFFLRPDVLGVVAVVVIIGIVYGALRRKFGRRIGL